MAIVHMYLYHQNPAMHRCYSQVACTLYQAIYHCYSKSGCTLFSVPGNALSLL